MDIIIEKGCGLDVHKETAVACIMGTGIKKEVRTYTGMTYDLLRLKGFHTALQKVRRYVARLIRDRWELMIGKYP